MTFGIYVQRISTGMVFMLISLHAVGDEYPAEAFAAKTKSSALKILFGTDRVESSDKLQIVFSQQHRYFGKSVNVNFGDLAPQRVAVLVTRRYEGRTPYGLIDPKKETPLVAVFNLTPSIVASVEASVALALPSRIDVIAQVDGKLYGASAEVKFKFRTEGEMNAHGGFIEGCPTILPPKNSTLMSGADKQRVISASSLYGGGITKVNLLFNHPMDTGWWFNSACERAPRNVIETLRLSQDDKHLGTIWMGAGMGRGIGLMFIDVKPASLLSVTWHDNGDNSAAVVNELAPDMESRVTAIQQAVLDNNSDWMRQILDEGIADSAKTEDALGKAANRGYSKIVKMLLDHGANIEAKFNIGQTALIIAAESQHEDTVRLLISKGANLNAHGDHIGRTIGNTPLTAAVRGLHRHDENQLPKEEIVRLLLAAGADVNGRATDGPSALQIARFRGFKNIVKLLEKAGGE